MIKICLSLHMIRYFSVNFHFFLWLCGTLWISKSKKTRVKEYSSYHS